jgi:hypothetical protein
MAASSVCGMDLFPLISDGITIDMPENNNRLP